MKNLLAAAAVLAATATAPAAQDLEGTYLSFDDERLMDAGIIVPVFEYVEILPDTDGELLLEVGYLHPVTRAENLPVYVRHGPDPVAETDVGVLQPAEGRRLTLRGPARIGDSTLAWSADLFAPSIHEPGRLEARESPFLAAAAEQGPEASVPVAVLGDVLLVTGADGTIHSYRRADLAAIRMTGLLASIANLSYAHNRACLAPLAEALATGTAYQFSDATRALTAEQLEVSEETLVAMRERGLGVLLQRLITAAEKVNEAAGRIIEAELASYDSFAAYAAASDGLTPVTDPDRRLRLFAVTRLHMFEAADLETPFAFEQSEIRDWLAVRHAEDPWAMTTPMIAVVTPDNWVTATFRLLQHEVDRLCPQE